MKKLFGAGAQLRSFDNVEYVLRHCDECARGVNPETGLMFCSLGEQNITHGEVRSLFQENRLAKLLLKLGLLSPDWQRGRLANFAALFGRMSASKVIGNLVTNAGFALAAGRLNGSGAPAAATYIAVGTGTTAASASDTTLQTETATSGLSRVNGTVSLVTTTVTNDTAQVTTTFTVSGTVAVTELGVLNAASSGTLLCRQVFSAINVVSGDSLAITWKVKMS